MTITRQWTEVSWMVGKTALEVSPSIMTAVFPSSPRTFFYQSKALVTKKGYHIIITRDTTVNRMLNDCMGMYGSTMDSLRAKGSTERFHGTSSCGLSVGGEKNKLPACVHLAINCVATNIQNIWYWLIFLLSQCVGAHAAEITCLNYNVHENFICTLEQKG